MMTEDTLDTRKAEVTERLADLRRQRGAALLDGNAFDHAEIDQLTAELSAIEAAEAEAVRRERATSAEQGRQRRRELLAAFKIEDARRLKAVADAETAAKRLGEALAEALGAGADCVLLMQALGLKPKTALEKRDSEIRFGGRLAVALRPVTGHRQTLGHLILPPPAPSHSADWVEDEAYIWAAEVAAIENMEI